MARRVADGRLVATVQATVRCEQAWVAWVVGAEFQGRGFGREAAAGMTDWLARNGIRQLRAAIAPGHAHSETLARSVGMAPTEETVDGERVWAG
ncbi:GNAT family N-acetyltransferase [Pseudonocardia phyllosphaerae]|uniref:GNAT family N-acetyltransferase n=1 Tax=Pseudonocardia phyllosphaerae TaxID=3390502 RepID=UPI0039780442